MKNTYSGAVAGVSVAVACTLGAYAGEQTVSNAVGLVAALQAFNAKKAPATPNIIYLEPGNYDVSAYNMKSWGSSGETTSAPKHLALAYVTVSGKTDNPRDTVIYGDGTDGIAHCFAGSFRNLTISNGCDTTGASSNEYRGGGVFSTGTGSIHSNVIVTCCRSGALGGGVASGTWYNSTIISNSTSSYGGGVYGGIFYNCNIVSNSSATGYGGGCYYGTVLHDCRVIGNRAQTYGGGVVGGNGKDHYCQVFGGVIADNYAGTYGGGTVRTDLLGGTVVSNNTAETNGGGVYTEAGVVVTNTIICCNTAKNGGGVYGKGFCSDCEIYGNTATENGGGINNGFATNCVIYANTAAYGGGSSSNECASCTISNNLAGVEGGGGCGGIYYDCLIACNMATGSVDKAYGGGLSGAAVHRCVISNNVVEAFGTASNGGAFGAGAYSSQIFDSTVLFNMNYGGTRDVYGGGAYSGCASNSLFTGNACYAKVSSGKNIQGGGGYATYFTNCVIRNNYTKSNSGCGINGGGANSCLISNNVGTSSVGYTIRQVRELQNCEVVGVVNVRNCSAVNCRFVNFTNGYYLAKNENVVMDPNMRDHIAGPISYSGTTSAGQELIFSGFVATNCLIANNRTSGGLFQTSSSLKVFLHNCTIANNVCEYTTLDATNGVLAYAVNCIFVGNKTANGTPRNMYFANNKNYFALTNCLIGSGRREVAPGYEANTVTNDDARFVGGDGPDKYALKWSSPACGKGLVMDWMMDATDIRQDPACPRLRDGMVDIGCYQCWLDPVGLGVIIR